jgi:ubiquinone/menaquinone biosynthesis C-methylase UbiE
LHEIEDKEKALSEINRVLKPNGWLFITEFHKKSLITILLSGFYAFHYKKPEYWFSLLEKNEFVDIIYMNTGPIAIVSSLKK